MAYMIASEITMDSPMAGPAHVWEIALQRLIKVQGQFGWRALWEGDCASTARYHKRGTEEAHRNLLDWQPENQAQHDARNALIADVCHYDRVFGAIAAAIKAWETSPSHAATCSIAQIIEDQRLSTSAPRGWDQKGAF